MNSLLRKSSLASLVILANIVFNPTTYAADTKPKFDCTLTDELTADKKPGDAKDTFSKTTPLIYLICESDEVEKGQSIKAEWIAADTNNIAPANYKIDEKSLDVKKELDDDQVFTANFSLSIPNKGWPVGSYRVDLYVDNKLSQSVKFTVK
ncbi:MAG: hypothetical protein ABI597_05035 [Gammaproteobacteria bacterium]